MQIKGHITIQPSNKTLCGKDKDEEVTKSSLYGELCAECAELADGILRRQIKLCNIHGC